MLSLFGKSIHIHIHMQDVVLMDIPDYFAMGGCRKAKKTRKILQLIKIMMKEPVKMAKCLRQNASFCLHGKHTFCGLYQDVTNRSKSIIGNLIDKSILVDIFR